jgi:hypothetical protein
MQASVHLQVCASLFHAKESVVFVEQRLSARETGYIWSQRESSLSLLGIDSGRQTLRNFALNK